MHVLIYVLFLIYPFLREREYLDHVIVIFIIIIIVIIVLIIIIRNWLIRIYGVIIVPSLLV